MGTRCNVIIIGKGFQIVLYRHWDGYPAETGADLIRAVDGCKSFAVPAAREGYGAAAVVRSLLDLKEPDGVRSVFEITDALHGDIEHVYQIHWPDGRGSLLGLKHAEVSSEAEIDDWRNRAKSYDLDDFRAMVNLERVKINVRTAALRKASESWGRMAPAEDDYQPV